MTVRNELRAVWALNVKDWKRKFRYPLSLGYFAFAPVMWLLPHLIFATALVNGRHSDTLESLVGVSDVWLYTAIGTIYYALVATTLWSTAFSIRQESWRGTIETIYVAPVSRFTLVGGATLHSIMHSSIGMTVQLIVIALWLPNGVSVSQLVVAGIFMLLGVVASLSIAMILTGLVLWKQEGYRLAILLDSFYAIAVPIAFPIVVLPGVLQKISVFIPITQGIEGFRNTLLFGFSWSEVGRIFVLLTMDIVALIIGYLMFSKIERHVRRKGQIGKY